MSASSFRPLTPQARACAIPHLRMRSRSSSELRREEIESPLDPRRHLRPNPAASVGRAAARLRRTRARRPAASDRLRARARARRAARSRRGSPGAGRLPRPGLHSARYRSRRPRRGSHARRDARALPSRAEARGPSAPQRSQATCTCDRRVGSARGQQARTPQCVSPTSSSSISHSRVPGSQRSTRSARCCASYSRRRTAPRPPQCVNASGSCSDSSSGKLILSTAGTSSRSTAMTSETFPPSYGSPTTSDQRSAHASTIPAKRVEPLGTSGDFSPPVECAWNSHRRRRAMKKPAVP